MKKRFLNYIKSKIKSKYPNYNNDKIDEIMYGIESLYLMITKSIIIFLIAYFLGILKEIILLFISFNILRKFAFGVHASNSITCLITSSTLFIIFSFASKYITLKNSYLLIYYIVLFLLILIYSPSDTVKRPIINNKKRKKFKILSCLIVIIYLFISMLFNNKLIINSLVFGSLIECILILPITYKLYKVPYNNYKNYGLNTSL